MIIFCYSSMEKHVWTWAQRLYQCESSIKGEKIWLVEGKWEKKLVPILFWSQQTSLPIKWCDSIIDCNYCHVLYAKFYLRFAVFITGWAYGWVEEIENYSTKRLSGLQSKIKFVFPNVKILKSISRIRFPELPKSRKSISRMTKIV